MSAISVTAPPSAPTRYLKARASRPASWSPKVSGASTKSQSRTGEVKERVDFRGNVLVPLDEAALRETLRRLKTQNIEALAVCLLFSFLHLEHEARVGKIASEEMPDCDISLSSEILPQKI